MKDVRVCVPRANLWCYYLLPRIGIIESLLCLQSSLPFNALVWFFIVLCYVVQMFKRHKRGDSEHFGVAYWLTVLFWFEMIVNRRTQPAVTVGSGDTPDYLWGPPLFVYTFMTVLLTTSLVNHEVPRVGCNTFGDYRFCTGPSVHDCIKPI